MEFFDINFAAGSGLLGTYRPAVSGEDLLVHMDALNIKKALVWHLSQCDYSAPEGNAMLAKIIDGNPRLYGSWAVLPPRSDEQVKPADFFKQMRDNRIAGLRVFPGKHRFLINRATFGGFMDEIAERKIPLLLSISADCVSWEALHRLMEEYPGLTAVICDTGIWGTDRYFRALLENFTNVYLDVSLVLLGDGVLEKLVEDYGADRLLFGTAFPRRAPESAALQLLHADISEEAKKQIAFSNSENLVSGVVL